jgi:CBS domain-containing protein
MGVVHDDPKGVRAMPRGLREVRVRDIVTSPIKMVRPDTPIRDLKILFALHDASVFAVVDERRRFRGVVTVFDLLRAFRASSSRGIRELGALSGERVVDIMSLGVWTLAPDEPITAAADMMLNRNVTAVPVVEGRRGDRRFVGMVHLRDVLGGLVFANPASSGRHAANAQDRCGERAATHHVSARREDDPVLEPEIRQAS